MVYDLEIENTHNFVANGIVAHNTTGKALANLNYTGTDQNILTASYGGVLKFALNGDGISPVASISGSTSMAALVVDNSGTGDLFTASASGNARLVLTSAGNLGIGTTSPVGLLHVQGACVTGDTKIRRKKKRKNGSDSDEWENVPLSDLEIGDMVMTLDENTREFVAQRLENIMNMGVKTVFGLKTASGKYIKTTESHPYLVQIKPERKLTGQFEVDFSGRIEDLTVDTYLTVASKTDAFTVKLSVPDKRILKKLHQEKHLSRFGFQIYAQLIRIILLLSGFKPTRLIIDRDYPGYDNEIKSIVAKDYPDLMIEFGKVFETSLAHRSAYLKSLDYLAKVTDVLAIKKETRDSKLSQARLRAEWIRRSVQTARSQRELYSGRGGLSRWIKVKELSAGVKIRTTDGWETIVSIEKLDERAVFDLQIANTHNFVANGIVAHNTTGKALAILNETGNQALFTASASGTTKFMISNSGYVGIGTPANSNTTLSTLDVRSLLGTQPVASISGATSMASLVVDNSGVGDIFTASSSGLNRFVITQSGNVGIGTTGPGAKLTVLSSGTMSTAGDTLATDAAIYGPGFKFGDSPVAVNLNLQSNATAGIDVGGSLALGGRYDSGSTNQADYGIIRGAKENATDGNYAGYLAFGTRFHTGVPTEKMRIDSQGNVGIGTTGPGYTLTVSGTAWVTSGAWSGSDVRWKENIQPITGSLDKVLQLQGVSFDWRKDEFPQNKFDDKTHLGFIAQSVEGVVPELVTTDTNGYKGLEYNGFSALLVNAIGEQQASISGVLAETASISAQLNVLVASQSATISLDKISPDISGLISEIPQIRTDVDLLKTEMASVSAQLTHTQANVASISAILDPARMTVFDNIDVSTVSASFANFSESLKVIGTTQLGDTTIGGKLTIGLVTVDDLKADISSLNGLLSLQNGGMTIDASGNASVSGNLKSKTVTTDGINLKDSGTGEYYCLTIKNGEISKTIGECK